MVASPLLAQKSINYRTSQWVASIGAPKYVFSCLRVFHVFGNIFRFLGMFFKQPQQILATSTLIYQYPHAFLGREHPICCFQLFLRIVWVPGNLW